MAVDNNDENQNESSNIRNDNVLDVSARKLEGKEVIIDTPGPSSESESEVIDGYKIIDSRILLTMVNTCSKCNTCGTVNNFTIEHCEKKRRGLCEVLDIKCTVCETVARSSTTSLDMIDRKVDINLRSVYGITSAGCGLAALRSFCSAMNIPPPIHPHTFNKYIRYIATIAEKNCQDSMNEAASKLRYGNEVATVSVSVDGTWQKRWPQFIIGCIVYYLN